MSAPHFARRYYGDHCCFLFLRLMICLSSAGGRPRLRPRSHCILADGAPSDGCGDAYGPSRGIGTETWACNTRKLASTQAAFKVLVLRLIVQCIRVIACRRVLHRLGSQDIHCYELFAARSGAVWHPPRGTLRGAPPEPRPWAGRVGAAPVARTNFRNDPAAGSPTATLLRLLLPLLVEYGSTSRARPGVALARSVDLYQTDIGNNDGRCVQMAGT